MKILEIIIIVVIAFIITSFFYEKQLGAIPFLLLAILFIYRGWKILKKEDK